MAIKSGLAAGLAWMIGSFLPGHLDEYAFYASLGAFTVMLPAVSASVKEVARMISGIVLGVTLATVVQIIAWSNGFTVGLVIAVGVLIGGLPWLGQQQHWVPLGAMYVLVFSEDAGPIFAVSLLVQVLIGTFIGVGVNTFLFPPLRMGGVSRTSDQLSALLVRRLRDVAEALEGNHSFGDTWHARADELERMRRRARDDAEHARASVAGNLRARRWSGERSRLMRRAAALEHVAFLLGDVTAVLTEFQDGRYRVLAGPHRAIAATMFEGMAELLDEPTVDRAEAVAATIRDLTESIQAATFEDARSRYLAGMITVSAGLCLSTVTDYAHLARD